VGTRTLKREEKEKRKKDKRKVKTIYIREKRTNTLE